MFDIPTEGLGESEIRLVQLFRTINDTLCELLPEDPEGPYTITRENKTVLRIFEATCWSLSGYRFDWGLDLLGDNIGIMLTTPEGCMISVTNDWDSDAWRVFFPDEEIDGIPEPAYFSSFCDEVYASLPGEIEEIDQVVEISSEVMISTIRKMVDYFLGRCVLVAVAQDPTT